MEYSPTQKWTALFIALGLAAIAVVDYFLTDDVGIGFFKMLAVFSSLALPGRKSSVAVAVGAGALVFLVGYSKLPNQNIEHLLSERFFVLLSLTLTLGLVLLLKKAQAEVFAQKNLVENLFENAPVLIALTHAKTRKILRINRFGAAMFESTPEEMQHLTASDFRKPPLSPEKNRLVSEALERKGFFEEEVETVTLKGRVFWAIFHVSKFNQTGQNTHLICITDIDALKKAEQKRLEIEQQFTTVFEQISEGILLVGMANGRIERANRAAGHIFGCEPENLIGLTVESLVPERFVRNHASLREKFAQNPTARQMGKGVSLFARRLDGSEFAVEISLSPMKTEGGKKHVIAFVVDVTERKTHEESIIRQKNELETLATRLRESNAELEKFAYVSSHDLQEPLRKIRAFGEMLAAKENLSEEGAETLARIQKSAARMQALIYDLLQFSRLNTRPPEFQRVNLVSVLQDVVADLEISRRESGASIRVGELPTIEADPTQMRQLFQNLISNALKFRREGEPPLVEIFSENTDNQSFVKIHVRDNGIGFDEKFRDEIFTVFQRLHGQKFPGTGIGLSICKKIAQRHGGDILAFGKPGEGSDFVVTLGRNIER